MRSSYAYKLSREAHHTLRKAVAHRKHVFLNFASSVVKRAGHICVMVDEHFVEDDPQPAADIHGHALNKARMRRAHLASFRHQPTIE